MSKQSLQKPVLVVDDEQDIRDLMEMTLMKMGLSVETAEGVNAAKKWLDSKKFSLVLTDMRMPDGSGLDGRLQNLDGDTVSVRANGRLHTVRIAEISSGRMRVDMGKAESKAVEEGED